MPSTGRIPLGVTPSRPPLRKAFPSLCSARRWPFTMATGVNVCQPTCCKPSAIILAPTPTSALTNPMANSSTATGPAMVAKSPPAAIRRERLILPWFIRRLVNSPQLNLAQRSGGLPAADAKRLRFFDFAWPQRDPFSRCDHVDQFSLIDPSFQAVIRNLHPDAIPVVLLKSDVFARLVFRSVHAIQTGNAHQRPAP